MVLKDFVKITEQPHFRYGKNSAEWIDHDVMSSYLPAIETIDKYNKPGMTVLERFQLAMQEMPREISNPIEASATVVNSTPNFQH